MCAVVGVHGTPDAAIWVRRALSALQHRGQESAGIAVADGSDIRVFKQVGLVSQALPESEILKLNGSIAIGHVRYSTAGKNRIEEAQPLLTECYHGMIAVVHNGNLIDQRGLKREVLMMNGTFQTTSDTEIALQMYAQTNKKTLDERLKRIGERMKAAFAMLFLTENQLAILQDPYGFRPLMIGQIGSATVIASESCAFTQLEQMSGQEADCIRDVLPGEIITVGQDGIKATSWMDIPRQRQRCIFEHVYFSRPDSITFGHRVQKVRRKLGQLLADVSKINADIVVPIPNSGIHAGIGYAEASGIPIEWALVRNQYIGRTFIDPLQSHRDNGVVEKLLPIVHLIEDKRVVLVDDSIVRGTTTRKIVRMVREVGKAREVHVAISCPLTISSCFYGIDTPRREELIASRMNVEEIRAQIGADSLTYNTLENLFAAVSPFAQEYCTSCYTNAHPLLDKFNLHTDNGYPERRHDGIQPHPTQG
ncbi:MAG: amidophosphoribosyltransferase [Candidatus Doudnabacteria bacterium]|nr:amidophosphoribosyltransferase [Candidatus Doudnabacteria bacterium]